MLLGVVEKRHITYRYIDPSAIILKFVFFHDFPLKAA